MPFGTIIILLVSAKTSALACAYVCTCEVANKNQG